MNKNSKQDNRDSLEGLTPGELADRMFQQFPIDDQLANGKPCPPISCLRYSLVDLLTKGNVILPTKLAGFGVTWKSDRP